MQQQLGSKCVPVSAAVWECWSPTQENLVMTSTRSTRPVEEYLLTTGSKLLLVYTKSTVICNWSVVDTREVG